MREWVRRLFEDYKFVRRAILAWAIWIVSVTIFRFFDIAEKMSGAATVFVAIIGLVGVAIGLYQWDRGRDDK